MRLQVSRGFKEQLNGNIFITFLNANYVLLKHGTLSILSTLYNGYIMFKFQNVCGFHSSFFQPLICHTYKDCFGGPNG